MKKRGTKKETVVVKLQKFICENIVNIFSEQKMFELIVL